ncbi:hypothetical protein [Paraclostridium bifermentans]|uniref:hypothetical protein n=1 Tax=Paraclostridium bifermentans TaxID=1490 RepID=UPI00359C2396
MTENRFKKGQYENALQYAKDILSNSNSVIELINKNNINEKNSEQLKEIEVNKN